MGDKPEPVVRIEECDRETCREFLGEYYGTAQEFDDALLMQFAKHRTAALARREAEIVELADAAERESKTCQQYANAVVRIVMNLRKQNGGGA